MPLLLNPSGLDGRNGNEGRDYRGFRKGTEVTTVKALWKVRGEKPVLALSNSIGSAWEWRAEDDRQNHLRGCGCSAGGLR